MGQAFPEPVLWGLLPEISAKCGFSDGALSAFMSVFWCHKKKWQQSQTTGGWNKCCRSFQASERGVRMMMDKAAGDGWADLAI